MPRGARSVARPGYFGNPFTINALEEAGYHCENPNAEVVKSFERWLNGDRTEWQGLESNAAATIILQRLPELKGKDLACWCPLDQPCHADVLLRLANP